MRLLSEVRGLPVVVRGGGPRLGTVASLAVDAASGTVTHLRFRAGRLRRTVAVPWAAVAVAGPGAVELRPGAAADPAPPRHTLLGRRVLTDRGDGRGTVLDAAFDPETGRLSPSSPPGASCRPTGCWGSATTRWSSGPPRRGPPAPPDRGPHLLTGGARPARAAPAGPPRGDADGPAGRARRAGPA
ncbi:PRC-barrel domain-containing protein [Streptomyces sp. SID8352]|uniref:PRC-barrel domain-containing protein n=1 Tax=Streptomyces sp. SID8352 TaxID=2690338 RepID=UPI0031F6551F